MGETGLTLDRMFAGADMMALQIYNSSGKRTNGKEAA